MKVATVAERKLRLYGLTEPELELLGQVPDRLMVALSILSDAQEELGMGPDMQRWERGRQMINRAKFLIIEQRKAGR